MSSRAIVMISFVIAVLASFHLYVGNRLIVQPDLPAPVAWLGGLALFALMLCVIVLPIAQRRGRRGLARLLAWPGYLWLGIGFWLLVTLAASDLVVWILGSPVLADEITRRSDSDVATLRAIGVTGLVGLATLLGAISAALGPRLRRVEVKLSGAAPGLDGFRIAQISDVHIGPILRGEFMRSVVSRVNALEPDLIAITGDLVDGPVDLMYEHLASLAELRARHGAFYVNGNHERYSNEIAWESEIDRLGVRVLRNERVRIDHGAGALDVAGIGDGREEAPGRIDRALRDRDERLPVVLLAHDPSAFRAASTRGVSLQLSGHTHGGQIWPFRYLVRLTTPWVAGLYRVASGAQLYVSRGTGFWGPPLRLLAPAEITEITLRVVAE